MTNLNEINKKFEKMVREVKRVESLDYEYRMSKGKDGEWVQGKIKKTFPNTFKLISRYQLQYDEFTASIMGVFTRDGEQKVRSISDVDYTRIRQEAEAEGFEDLGKEWVVDAVRKYADDNRFDSGIDWGNRLVWDKVERCKDLLSRYFGAEDTPYSKAVSLYITSAMGARLMTAGSKADMAVVLVGDQGVGKSTCIQAMAPLDDSYAEVNLRDRDDDQSRKLRGKIICEMAELQGLKSRDAESIKAWVSRTHEEWIPKYQEFANRFARRFTLWGSTNEDEFLTDVTGNRRWLPVNVVNKMDSEALKKDRDQIWAEAIQIYKNSGVLYEEANRLAEEARQDATHDDPIVDKVLDFIARNSNSERWKNQDVYDFIFGIDHDVSDMDAKRVSRAFRSLGHKSCRFRDDKERQHRGFKNNGYKKPESEGKYTYTPKDGEVYGDHRG